VNSNFRKKHRREARAHLAVTEAAVCRGSKNRNQKEAFPTAPFSRLAKAASLRWQTRRANTISGSCLLSARADFQKSLGESRSRKLYDRGHILNTPLVSFSYREREVGRCSHESHIPSSAAEGRTARDRRGRPDSARDTGAYSASILPRGRSHVSVAPPAMLDGCKAGARCGMGRTRNTEKKTENVTWNNRPHPCANSPGRSENHNGTGRKPTRSN